LPQGLQSVTFGRWFDKDILLPLGLRQVIFDVDFGRKVSYPKGTHAGILEYLEERNFNFEEI